MISVMKKERVKKIASNILLVCATLVLCFILAELSLSVFYPMKEMSPTEIKALTKENGCALKLEFVDSLGRKVMQVIRTHDFMVGGPLLIERDGVKQPIPTKMLPEFAQKSLKSIGATPFPHCEKTTISETPPNLAYYKINNIGLRENRPTKQKKEPGTKRVLVMGDSFAFGAGLDQNETLSYYLDKRLDEDFEVLNTGMSGLSSLQSHILYKEVRSELEPDLIVFMHFSNDLNGNLQKTFYERPVYVPRNETIRFTDRKTPTTEESGSWLQHKLHLGALLKEGREFFKDKKPANNITLIRLFEKNPKTEIEKSFKFNCDKVLAPFKDSVEANNATFIVVYIPSKQEMHAPELDKLARKYNNTQPQDFDNTLVRNHLKQCVKKHDINYIDLTLYWKKYTKKHPLEWYQPGGHWSKDSTNFTAKIIKAWMKKNKVTK